MAPDKLVISGIGMISAVGISASQSCASIKAGISRNMRMPTMYYCMADDPYFEDGEELIAAPVSFLESMRKTYSKPAEWLALMGEKAFMDLVQSSDYSDARDGETGLFVSLPSQCEDHSPGMKDEFIYHFHNRIEKDLFPCEAYCFTGHTGVFTIIEAARTALAEGKISRAIVGGIESCLFDDWLKILDDDYKIKSNRNIDGYIPGEAAAFLLLEKGTTTPGKSTVIFTIDGMSADAGLQPQSFRGSSLKNVVSELLDDTDEPPVIYCDLNGESKRMEEWGFVKTNLGVRLGNPVHLEHPAGILGDIGAATGAALIISAMYHLQITETARYAALIFTASENGERRAVRLKKTLMTMIQPPQTDTEITL